MKWSLFKFFYSSLFTFTAIVLFFALIITPADAIRQAYRNNQIQNIFIISGIYLLTIVLSIIHYASRLYHVRKTLADIPKYYVPVKKGDLNRRGYRVIKAELVRSAVVAYESRPRGIEPVQENNNNTQRQSSSVERGASTLQTNLTRVSTSGTMKYGPLPWGTINHPDHSPPVGIIQNPQVPPDTHYPAVITKLPDILSTRATEIHPSLCIPNHGSSMRSYLFDVLGSVGLVESVLAEAFIVRYEKARFSQYAIGEDEFDAIMHMFASILHGLTEAAAALGIGASASQSSSSSTSEQQRIGAIEEQGDGPYGARSSTTSSHSSSSGLQPNPAFAAPSINEDRIEEIR